MHEASGATCQEFPLLVELSVRICAIARIDRYTLSIWIPCQCALNDLALLLPLRGVHSDATRSAITFFTRNPGGYSFYRPHVGSVQVRTLLGQKDAMALPENVSLSALDENNRLTILAQVLPRQEGAPNHHARPPRHPTSDSAADERKVQHGGSSVPPPTGKVRTEIREQACMAIDTMILLTNGSYSPVQSLAGRMVAGGATLVNRVHRFYLHKPVHRLVLFKENWITESHFIKQPADGYYIWVPLAGDNHQHGPLPGMWTQADGRQW